MFRGHGLRAAGRFVVIGAKSRVTCDFAPTAQASASRRRSKLGAQHCMRAWSTTRQANSTRSCELPRISNIRLLSRCCACRNVRLHPYGSDRGHGTAARPSSPASKVQCSAAIRCMFCRSDPAHVVRHNHRPTPGQGALRWVQLDHPTSILALESWSSMHLRSPQRAQME